MTNTIIFDLAEVCLSGLLGVDKNIALALGLDNNEVLYHLTGKKLEDLFKGEISEYEYWRQVMVQGAYPIKTTEYGRTVAFLEHAIRQNFKEIEGTRNILLSLKKQGFDLVLFSDHAKEWIEYCEEIYPIKDIFNKRHYSFNYSTTKKDPRLLQRILSTIDTPLNSVIYIDDNQTNLDIAKKHGIANGILFVDYKKLIHDLRKYEIII